MLRDDEVDNLPVDIAEEFLRPVEFRYQDNIAKVHWWYHPDSYDEYIPLGEVDDPSDAPDTLVVPSQWRVCCRWIRDLEVFNEWGNEVDYEIDTRDANAAAYSAVEGEGDAAGAMRRKKNRGKKPGGWKRDITGTQVVPASVHATEKMMPNLLPPSADEAVEVLRVVDVTQSSAELTEHVRGGKRKAEDQGERSSKRGVEAPGSLPPSWFDIDAIHPQERVFLPEFFDGSVLHLSPAIYKSTRNSIIDEYKSTPQIYLSATACRKRVSGDIRAIIAIHDFLDSHGIINYAVDPALRPPRGVLVFPTRCASLGALEEPLTKGPTTAREKELTERLLKAVSVCAPGDWAGISNLMDGDLTPAECLRYFASLTLPLSTSETNTIVETVGLPNLIA